MLSLEDRVLRAKARRLHMNGHGEREIARQLKLTRWSVRQLLGRLPGYLSYAPCECDRCGRLKWVTANRKLRVAMFDRPHIACRGRASFLALFGPGGQLEGIPVSVESSHTAKLLGRLGVKTTVMEPRMRKARSRVSRKSGRKKKSPP